MIYLRKLKKEDLMSLWEMAYSQLNPVWKQYDAPYYDDYQYFSNFKEFELQKSESILSNSNRLGIFVDDKLVGTVSRYWVCKETRWMELGIGIYDKKFWNTGIGKVAMLQWIDRTFQDYLELEHLGLTTWSGNIGMMKLAEKLILFENQIQTTSASPYRTQVQLAASFLVCSLIFIEYKNEKRSSYSKSSLLSR
ncbi:GNAT family acetyltransferase [Streptococcus pseudopneumoniae]|nr:GNAT family acetyltransferase [Streptococcus pseudopneumoniae]KPL44659.1 GNAT family acetyltransferase [Streptococcus pseudopneumoniae]